MATKRRLAGNIRREIIAAELESLRKGNAELLASNLALQSENDSMRSLLWEFLSTHCAPLDLRARATAAVGKPPLTFGTKEQSCE